MTDFQVEDFVSCDIETLGLSVDSSIIQIGICWYNEGEYKTASSLVKPDVSRSDQSTLTWWADQQEQGNTVFADAMSLGERTLAQGIHLAIESVFSGPEIISYPKMEVMEWWFRGPQFDEAMLRHQCGGDEGVIWKYYNVRCQRTLEKTVLDLGYTMGDILQGYQAEGVKHDAGYDAEMQARSIVGCKKILHDLKVKAGHFDMSRVAMVSEEDREKNRQRIMGTFDSQAIAKEMHSRLKT